MSNVENVCPQVLRGVARELRRLAACPPAGVKLVLRDDDLTDVVAHIEGPADTPYSGGVFRVRLVLGREFPSAPPRAFFLTRIFHPNVSAATGEVCVNTLKRDWRPELGLEHALLAVKCLLIAPNPESALNAEAAALLRDKYDDYFARAKLLADIHARPQPAAPAAPADRPRATQEGPADSTEGGARNEDGPCAKRERRPTTTDPSSHSATSHSATSHSATSHSATSHSATSHGATSHGATSHGATSHGTTSHGATSHGTTSHGTGARSSKDKDRRRILKRL